MLVVTRPRRWISIVRWSAYRMMVWSWKPGNTVRAVTATTLAWASERDLPHREHLARHSHRRDFSCNRTLLNTFRATTDQGWLDFIGRHRPFSWTVEAVAVSDLRSPTRAPLPTPSTSPTAPGFLPWRGDFSRRCAKASSDPSSEQSSPVPHRYGSTSCSPHSMLAGVPRSPRPHSS